MSPSRRPCFLPSSSLESFAMTVKMLMHWQPNPGTTLNSQILTELCQCVEGFNGVKDGRWKTAMTFYRAMSREPTSSSDIPRDLLGLVLHDHPSKYFFVLRVHRLVVEADFSIQSIMEKLQSYKGRVVLNFEGFQYQLGDFKLRVGKCIPALSETLRGIMMEVEYLPLSSIERSRPLLEEFFDIWQETVARKSLPGHFIHIEANFAEYGLEDHYTSQHTALQYASCMAQLMASVRN